MTIRQARETDIPKMMDLLSQVLEVHAAVRPDIFVPGTTKYSPEELKSMFQDEKTPVYVAVDDDDDVLGYAFCQWRETPKTDLFVPFASLYIDDLCVDAPARGEHIGQALVDYVKAEAKKRGCYEVTLNVWTGNESALRFYEAMGFRPQKTTMELILS